MTKTKSSYAEIEHELTELLSDVSLRSLLLGSLRNQALAGEFSEPLLVAFWRLADHRGVARTFLPEFVEKCEKLYDVCS